VFRFLLVLPEDNEPADPSTFGDRGPELDRLERGYNAIFTVERL
jgi:hypothetical protein